MSNSVDGDLAELNDGGTVAVIVKYSSDGELEWITSYDWSHFYQVALASDGGYVAVGYTRGGWDSKLQNGTPDALYIRRFTRDGAQVKLACPAKRPSQPVLSACFLVEFVIYLQSE